MRIPFYKKENTPELKLIEIIQEYDIVKQTYPSLAMSFDNIEINDIQTYTDDSRYILDIFEIDLNRCYNRQSEVEHNNEYIKNAKIQVFSIKFNFNMDISFKLFQDNWANYWHALKDDINIHFIKPLVDSFGSVDLGYFIFKSLFTSYIVKMLDIIKNNNLMCVKQNDRLIFAYGVENNNVYNSRNHLLDLFLDAIYEMVYVTSSRGYYEVSQNKYYNEIDVMKFYDIERTKTKKKTYVAKDYNKFL